MAQSGACHGPDPRAHAIGLTKEAHDSLARKPHSRRVMKTTGRRGSTGWRLVRSAGVCGLVSLLDPSSALGAPQPPDAGVRLIGIVDAGPAIGWSGFKYAPPAIVSGGVLPLYGSCLGDPECSGMKAVRVYDTTTNALVSGHIEIAPLELGDPWAIFVPDAPFEVGVKLRVEDGVLPAVNTFDVEVVAPTPLTSSSYKVVAGLRKDRKVLSSTCCPVTGFAKQRCIADAEQNDVVFGIVLSEAELVAAQYVFELELRDATSDQLIPISYQQTDLTVSPMVHHELIEPGIQSYCYKVLARPIVGGDSIELESSCIPNDLTNLGRTERPKAELDRWLATCEVVETETGAPPVAQAPDAGTDARATPADADANEDDTEPSVTKRSGEGCQLAAGSASGGSVLVWTLGLLLWTRRRGQSKSARMRDRVQ